MSKNEKKNEKRQETVVKSHIQGIVPAELQYRFIELARWKAFIHGDPQKGAISNALSEAMELWLKFNAEYENTLEEFKKYEMIEEKREENPLDQ